MVGVLLTLYTTTQIQSDVIVRCNLSSWYVRPRFRAFAAILDLTVTRRRDTTYVNVSPAAQTFALQGARGFSRYCKGQMLAIPLLSRPSGKRAVKLY